MLKFWKNVDEILNIPTWNAIKSEQVFETNSPLISLCKLSTGMPIHFCHSCITDYK